VEVIALVGPPEVDQPANVYFWSCLVIRSQRNPASGQLEAEIAHSPCSQDGYDRSDQGVVLSEGTAAAAGIRQSACIEGVACLPVAGESVPQHYGVVIRLMVEFTRGLSLGSRDREEARRDGVDGDPAECSYLEDFIYSRHDSWIDIRAVLIASVLLLECRVKESVILDERAAQSKARSIAAEVCLVALTGQRLTGVESPVLRKYEGIPVKLVGSSLSHDINRAARGSSELSSQAIIDDLKLPDYLKRQLSPA
jgi:hypothetical protein